jgi:glycosyltransferase involved in cell wall biosynthesis
MSDSGDMPFVSVIIPAYNEEHYIEKCLTEWVNQDYPKDRYEVLVYDGMSTDRTAEIVREFEKKYPGLVFYRKNPKRKQVYAINAGIRESRGDFVITYSGAHGYPSRDFLRKNVETYMEVSKKEPRLGGVGGTVIRLHENRLSKLVALIYSSPVSGASSFWLKSEPHFALTVPYGCYPRWVFEEVGLFDEDMAVGEDFEFNLRLNKRGYKVFFNPEIRSYYFTRSTWKGFLKQTFNYGAVKGVALRKGYFSLRWLFPLGFLGFEALLPFVQLLVWLFVLYWLVLFGEGLRLTLKRKDLDGIFLPPVLFLFHNLIGMGFVAGLILHKRAFR